MKDLYIKIQYQTSWGERVYVRFNSNGMTSEIQKELALSCHPNGFDWYIKLNIPKETTEINILFLILKDEIVVKQEYSPRKLFIGDKCNEFNLIWTEEPLQNYFYTSMFTDAVFHHEPQIPVCKQRIQLYVTYIPVSQDQELILVGNISGLGNWNYKEALSLRPIEYGKWWSEINIDDLNQNQIEYKLAIRDKSNLKLLRWENGNNRIIKLSDLEQNKYYSYELKFRSEWINWRGSGVATPVFSLRSENSFGIGDFTDLNLLIDWAAQAKMSIIQILPINDTSTTFTWTDSYPYNSISIYALHPIYLGISEYPLRDETKYKIYKQQAKALNELTVVDYKKVIQLKTNYIRDLFLEQGGDTISTEEYRIFYQKNEHWLFAYACFCYFRDLHQTSKISDWGEFSVFDPSSLNVRLSTDQQMKSTFDQVCFCQFLLHKQLIKAKQYAHRKGLVLKGDLPIGISPNSVEAWTEPQLFNLDSQTGAPPDDFAIDGQNWGFPTYNWAEMKKTGYQWWINRFRKMADYFDAYRIDHILGFFRIWEIPDTALSGLLGHFSPAMPLSLAEIGSHGVNFDPSFITPSVHSDDLQSLFGEFTEEVKDEFLIPNGEYYQLKNDFGTQRNIETHFHSKNDDKNKKIRKGLDKICTEVLFLRDPLSRELLHPRIYVYNSMRFHRLSIDQQRQIGQLHDYFFYFRHTDFWKNEALEKLPNLINATNMLTCGEDLGMVPMCVPDVMNQLKILSLEIQRMPKEFGVRFGDLNKEPYLSVSTTSTHDMSTMRMWWEENKDETQQYYSDFLGLAGIAPSTCNPIISLDIIRAHLKAPAMLTIFPIQDWLAISEKLRRKNAHEERINIPSDPKHNWNYRLHLNLEQLLEEKDFISEVYFLNSSSGR